MSSRHAPAWPRLTTIIRIVKDLHICALTSCAREAGGAREDRTPDLLRARQALSQLSYGPKMVGLAGVEPATSPLSGVRSNQLSYRPNLAAGQATRRLDNLCGCSNAPEGPLV